MSDLIMLTLCFAALLFVGLAGFALGYNAGLKKALDGLEKLEDALTGPDK